MTETLRLKPSPIEARARFPFPGNLRRALELSPQRVVLPDGRVLAFDERGDPEGHPVIWFHGSPSCRLEGVMLEPWGHRLKLRFLVPDRPGLGCSDPNPGWTMMDHVRDVAALADALDVPRFGVMGGSGGGPFVFAAALALAERLDFAVAMASAGAFTIPELRANISWNDRLTAWTLRNTPTTFNLSIHALKLASRTPPAMAHVMARFAPWAMPGREPAIARLAVHHLREVLAQGIHGAVEDTRVMHGDWGFELGEVRAPVDLYQGTRDTFVPVAYAEVFAQRIPDLRLILCEGDGHFEAIFDLARIVELSAPRFPRWPA